MPTTIATLGRERTIATLARHIYRIEGRGSAELQRRAEAALLAANPRLASAEGFRTGDPIVVPAVRGATLAGEVKAAAVEGKGLSVEATLRLQALGSRVEDRFRRAAENSQQTLERLDDPAFLAEASKALPESVDLIAKARDRLKQETQQAEELSDRLRKAIAAAIEGIKTFER